MDCLKADRLPSTTFKRPKLSQFHLNERRLDARGRPQADEPLSINVRRSSRLPCRLNERPLTCSGRQESTRGVQLSKELDPQLTYLTTECCMLRLTLLLQYREERALSVSRQSMCDRQDVKHRDCGTMYAIEKRVCACSSKDTFTIKRHKSIGRSFVNTEQLISSLRVLLSIILPKTIRSSRLQAILYKMVPLSTPPTRCLSP
ncbi:hypothetical protein KZ810_09945 [Sphingomonas sp. RHCKR47]|uniref:hypothetical protein n=1 Tax=Sphingomonas citricola TaxID=2862498 RepID=UPI001CA55720|nr:hypothetical protein [Sphingomonas citricola]MBW6523817.1 hypothetical protein [Sphingomonas citricola]